jgi:lactoylglutathione lyase
MKVNYAIVFVSDMHRSIAFYRDVLGLPLKFETSHWTEFQTEGATLALHQSDDPPMEGGPPREAPGTCRTGFQVPDLAAFHEQMLAKDVPCIQEPKEVFGTKLAQYLDPDGMVLGVGEARS